MQRYWSTYSSPKLYAFLSHWGLLQHHFPLSSTSFLQSKFGSLKSNSNFITSLILPMVFPKDCSLCWTLKKPSMPSLWHFAILLWSDFILCVLDLPCQLDSTLSIRQAQEDTTINSHTSTMLLYSLDSITQNSNTCSRDFIDLCKHFDKGDANKEFCSLVVAGARTG